MSSPNIKACAAAAAAGSNQQGMKTISIGKDQHTIPIITIPALDAPLWKRSASFDQFSKVLTDQLRTHPVADLLPIVAEELPIETFSAYQEADAFKRAVEDQVWNVNTMTPTAFLNAEGSVFNKITSALLKDRPAGISYIRIRGHIDGKGMDNRCQQPPFSLQYCLHLPHSMTATMMTEITWKNSQAEARRRAGTRQQAETEAEAEQVQAVLHQVNLHRRLPRQQHQRCPGYLRRARQAPTVSRRVTLDHSESSTVRLSSITPSDPNPLFFHTG